MAEHDVSCLQARAKRSSKANADKGSEGIAIEQEASDRFGSSSPHSCLCHDDLFTAAIASEKAAAERPREFSQVQTLSQTFDLLHQRAQHP